MAQVDDAVKQVPLVAETTIIGGARRQVRVLLDPVRLASRNLSAAGIVPMLQQANRQYRRRPHQQQPGGDHRDRRLPGQRARTSATWWSACLAARPVYLREVAEIMDGAEEPSNTCFSAAAPRTVPA